MVWAESMQKIRHKIHTRGEITGLVFFQGTAAGLIFSSNGKLEFKLEFNLPTKRKV